MKKSFKKILLGILIIFSIVSLNGAYYVFSGQFKSVKKLEQGKELNLYECCSIYTMHVGVWMFGWPMSPIAARDCFLLHFPHKENKHCFYKMTSAIKVLSPKVAQAIMSMKGKPLGSTIAVSWNGDDAYSSKSKEHVAAIAINPCTIIKAAYMDDGMPLYLIQSSMQYPKYSESRFSIGQFTIILHEGLFRYLQDKHWLSCYTAEYGVFECWAERFNEAFFSPL